MAHRFARLWRALVRCACWLTTLVALVYLCSYVIDAHKRTTKAPGCQWNAVPNPGKSPYSARFCYLTKEAVLLRVYDETGQLVAERPYTYSDLARFYWEPNGLGYISDDRGSFVELPPGFIERLRAKLP